MHVKSFALAVPSCQATLEELLRRVQGEYEEMPGLALTMPQAQRLWAMDQQTCASVLSTLVERRFLRTTARGRYVRTEHTRPARTQVNVDPREGKESIVYVYLAAAHQNGSTEALELAHELSSWHDQMVMHARAVAREGTAARCDESCPHARAIELWRAACEILGDAAHQFAFLKTAVTSAAKAPDELGQPEPVGSGAVRTSREAESREERAHAKSAGRR